MQTWKTEKMSAEWEQCRQSLLANLPDDWTYVFFTDEQMFRFVKNEFPDVYDNFVQMPYGVQRADVLRYLWLYKYGGIYLDLDYKILKNFTSFFDSIDVPLYVLYSANTPFILTNSLIAAKPGLEFLLALAKKSVATPLGSWWSFTKHTDVMTSTGPIAFNSAVKNSQVPYAVLPNALFLPSSPFLENDKLFNNAFMVAVDGGSWNSTDSVVINFLNRYKTLIIFLLVCAMINVILDRFIFSQNLYYLVKKVKNLLKNRNKNAFHLVDSAINEITNSL